MASTSLAQSQTKKINTIQPSPSPPSSSFNGRDWSSLPPDLLRIISSVLNAVDYQSFTKVCTSWAKSKAQSPPHMPIIMLTSDGDDDNKCTLYSIVDKASYNHRLQTLNLKSCTFVGSQYGWLVVFDPQQITLSMFNPLTQQSVELPSPRRCIDRYYQKNPGRGPNNRNVVKAVMSCSPDDSASWPAVLALFGEDGVGIYCCSGGKDWRVVDWGKFNEIYCSNREFYAYEVRLYRIDIDRHGCKGIQLAGQPEHHSYDEVYLEHNYLVKVNDGLFLVWRHFDEDKQRTDKIVVYKHDVGGRSWIEVHDLEGHSFFVGTNCSFAYSPREVPGLKEDIIYYTDDWPICSDLGYRECKDVHWSRDVGSFDIRSGKFSNCPSIHAQIKTTYAIWLAPPPSMLQSFSFNR